MRRILLIAVLVIAVVTFVLGVGISVSPGTFLIQNVPIGEEYSITGRNGFRIRFNKQYSSGVYVLSPKKPSDDGTKATGFYDFPDPDWFHLERDTLILAIDSMKASSMSIEFPNDPSLYNRHFLLGVDVNPTLESTTGMIAVGAYLLYRFETESRADIVPELPSGEMVFVPSVIKFENLGSAENKSQNLKIFLGGKNKRKVKLYRLDPESDVAKLTIFLTQGYQRVPEGVVFFPDEIEIDENGGKMFIQIAFDDRLPFKRMEEIIIAEQPDGNKAFMRVLLKSDS